MKPSPLGLRRCCGYRGLFCFPRQVGIVYYKDNFIATRYIKSFQCQLFWPWLFSILTTVFSIDVSLLLISPIFVSRFSNRLLKVRYIFSNRGRIFPSSSILLCFLSLFFFVIFFGSSLLAAPFEHPLDSFQQLFVVVDGELAFVMGGQGVLEDALAVAA